MISYRTMFAALACTMLTSIGMAESTLEGKWRLESSQQVPAACRNLSLEFTRDGRVIRTAGDLVYSSRFILEPKKRGWLLRERLARHNGQASCQGVVASQAIQHLARMAYVEVHGDSLRYFRDANGEPTLTFVRELTPHRLARAR